MIHFMVFSETKNIFFFFLKTIIRALILVAVIPFGILVFFLNFFPEFTSEGGYLFWILASGLNILAYFLLRKPISWTVSRITLLFDGEKGFQ